MKNYRLTLSYEGTRYRGWQKQGNTSGSIQEKLEDTLSRILGEDIALHGSGRTDGGVHALGQVASFKTNSALASKDILSALRNYLPEDIGALSLEEANPRFHARLNALSKTYEYRIWNSPLPCVFPRRWVWIMQEPLDLQPMKQAAALLCGTHDFSAFRTGKSNKSAVRTIHSIELFSVGEELRIRFTGDGFLYNMVRILTGTLVEVGEGKRSPLSMKELLHSKNRSLAGITAPAQGLTLLEVHYKEKAEENRLSAREIKE